jgi:HTH-type transcriptional regulator / antitoxin HipB
MGYPKMLAFSLASARSQVSDRVSLRQKTVSAFESNPAGTNLDTFFRLLSALGLELQIIPKEETGSSALGWNEEW